MQGGYIPLGRKGPMPPIVNLKATGKEDKAKT